MKSLWNREPAAILGALQAVLALAITFGIGLTVEQVGAILAASAALLAVLLRQTVTAPASKAP